MAPGRHQRALLAAAAAACLAWAHPAKAESTGEPSVLHGLGQVIAGVLFELPKTVLDATLTEPVVLGTVAGLFAGTVNALRVTAGGLVEMAEAFNPIGLDKKKARRRW
jgi:hypothetical protein